MTVFFSVNKYIILNFYTIVINHIKKTILSKNTNLCCEIIKKILQQTLQIEIFINI